MSKPGHQPAIKPRLRDLEKRLRHASSELSAACEAFHDIPDGSASVEIRCAKQSLREVITALQRLRNGLKDHHASHGIPSHLLLPAFPSNDDLDAESTSSARHLPPAPEKPDMGFQKYYARRLLRADGTLVALESEHCTEDWIAIANTQGFAERCPHRVREIELWREGQRIFTSQRAPSPLQLTRLRPWARLVRERLSGTRQAPLPADDSA